MSAAIDVHSSDVNEAAAVPAFSFVPRPTLDRKADQECALSNSKDGIQFDNLADGTVLELETKHHRYTLVKSGRGQALISGHPALCPEPVAVEIKGSTERDSTLRVGFIACGMHLMFKHPTFYAAIITSRILKLRQIS
jgi:hypothetical protein